MDCITQCVLLGNFKERSTKSIDQFIKENAMEMGIAPAEVGNYHLKHKKPPPPAKSPFDVVGQNK